MSSIWRGAWTRICCDVYLRDRIFVPLGMEDTSFVPTPDQHKRQASVHQRQGDGSLVQQPLSPPSAREFFAGGGGLCSTGRDYLTFLRMLLQTAG